MTLLNSSELRSSRDIVRLLLRCHPDAAQACSSWIQYSKRTLKRAGVMSTPICCSFPFMGAALFS